MQLIFKLFSFGNLLNKRFSADTTTLLYNYLKKLENELSENCELNRIWMYWDAGYENAPDLIKLSYRSWVKNNPDFEVVFLDDDTLPQYLGFSLKNALEEIKASSVLTKAAQSDLIRLFLLRKFGGVWVDATTLCIEPLTSWLDLSVIDFFIFRQPASCVDRQMVSWFMAASSHSVVLRDLLRESVAYLTSVRKNTVERPIGKEPSSVLISREGTGFRYLRFCEKSGVMPYFWMFYIYNEVIKNYPNFSKMLNDKVNKYVQPKGDLELFKRSYIAKQTYRLNDSEVNRICRERVHFLESVGKL